MASRRKMVEDGKKRIKEKLCSIKERRDMIEEYVHSIVKQAEAVAADILVEEKSSFLKKYTMAAQRLEELDNLLFQICVALPDPDADDGQRDSTSSDEENTPEKQSHDRDIHKIVDCQGSGSKEQSQASTADTDKEHSNCAQRKSSNEISFSVTDSKDTKCQDIDQFKSESPVSDSIPVIFNKEEDHYQKDKATNIDRNAVDKDAKHAKQMCSDTDQLPDKTVKCDSWKQTSQKIAKPADTNSTNISERLSPDAERFASRRYSGSINSPGSQTEPQRAAPDDLVLSVLKFDEQVLIEVIVTHVDSPSLFWLQPRLKDIQTMVEKMQVHYSTRPPEPLFTSLKLGAVVCCQYQVDDDWYRARVIRIFSTSDPRSQGNASTLNFDELLVSFCTVEVAVTDKTVVDVLYIDYGNQERTTVDKLQPLHQLFTAYPVYAFPCALAKVGPPDNKAAWPPEICISLGEMLISKGNMYASLSKIRHCPLVFTELYLPTPEMSVEKLQKLGPVESILFNIGKVLIQQKSATELPNDTIASAFGLGQIKIGLPDSNLELGLPAFDLSAPGSMQLWVLNDMDVCNAQSPAITSPMNVSCNSPPCNAQPQRKDVTPETDERAKGMVSTAESELESLQSDDKHETLLESHPAQEGISSCHDETLKKQAPSGPQAASLYEETVRDKTARSTDRGTQHEDLSSCAVQHIKDESQNTDKSASVSSNKDEEKEASTSQPSLNITNTQNENKVEPPEVKPECTASETDVNLVPMAAGVTHTQASNEGSMGSTQIASVSDQDDGKTAPSASSVSVNEELEEGHGSHDSSDSPRLVSVEETVSDKGDTGYSSVKENADEKEEGSTVCTASLEEKEADLPESASEKITQSTTSTDTMTQPDLSSTSDELADEYFELMLDKEMAQAAGSAQSGTDVTTASVNEAAGDRVCESEETASVNSRLSSVSKDTDKRQTQDSVSEASSKSSSQLQEKLRNIGLPDKIPEKCQNKFDSWITDQLDTSTEAESTAEVPEIKCESIPEPANPSAADEQTLPQSAKHNDETGSPNPAEEVTNKPEGADGSGSSRVIPQVFVTLDDECGFSFLISYVDSPGKFYVHLVSEESQQTLMKNINCYFQDLSRSKRQKLSKEYKPSYRDICCAKYKEDDKIYRAEILCIHYDEQDRSKEQRAKSSKCSQVKVLYVDFGNVDWISPRWVYPLPQQFRDLPRQAICCSLANIEPVIVDGDSDSSDDWGDKATKAFVDMTGFEKKLFGMCVGSKPGQTVSGTYENPLSLLVYDTSGEEDVFINEQLIKQDMAAAVLPPNDDQNKGHQVIKSESKEDDDVLDAEEEEMTMDNWDPMADDYLSLRNSYLVNTDDPGVASVGISAEGERQVCQFFASGRKCFRGINCPYLHIRDSGGPSIERRQVFCTNDLEQSLTPPEEGSWVALEMSAIFNPAHFYAVFPFGTGPIDELINKDSHEDEGYEGSGCCAETLDSMMESLNDYYNSRGSYRDSDMAAFAVGEIIVAKYSPDERWYRAKVIESDPDNFKVHIFYVDFGNSEWVEEMNLRQIQPQFMHLPFQILECFLPLEPLSSDGKWTTEAREYFTRLVDGKVLFAQVLSGSHTGIISLDLYDTTGDQEVNINQTLIDKGYARPLQTQSARVIPDTTSSVIKKKPEPIYMPG